MYICSIYVYTHIYIINNKCIFFIIYIKYLYIQCVQCEFQKQTFTKKIIYCCMYEIIFKNPDGVLNVF